MGQFVSLSRGLAASVIVTCSLTACSSLNIFSDPAASETSSFATSQQGQVLWQSGHQYVKLVNKGKGSTANDHPIQLSAADLEALLSSVYVSERFIIKSHNNPVFSPGELQVLSTTVASALSQAQADEDVTFATIGFHPGAFDKERKSTSGRLFVKNGRLHIIFGLLHDEYSGSQDEEGNTQSMLLVPGTRMAEADLRSEPSLTKGHSFHRDPKTGDDREDWLVIDIDTVLATQGQQVSQSRSQVSSELLQDVAQSKQETDNIRQDISSMKEVLFELTGEIERLKAEVERLKAQP